MKLSCTEPDDSTGLVLERTNSQTTQEPREPLTRAIHKIPKSVVIQPGGARWPRSKRETTAEAEGEGALGTAPDVGPLAVVEAVAAATAEAAAADEEAAVAGAAATATVTAAAVAAAAAEAAAATAAAAAAEAAAAVAAAAVVGSGGATGAGCESGDRRVRSS